MAFHPCDPQLGGESGSPLPLGGQWQSDRKTYVEITLDYLRSLGLRRIDGVHLQAEPAPNTALQAKWIVSQVRDHGITSLALAVSPYHLPRAYLTLLKAFNEVGVRLPIIPVPVAVARTD